MITLGVIGVVAALTMPSLINKYRAKVFVNKFKKTLSVVNQGVKTSKAVKDMDFSMFPHNDFGAASPRDKDSYFAIFSSTLKGEWGSIYYPWDSPTNGYLYSEIGAYVGSGMYPFKLLDGAEVYVCDSMGFLYTQNISDGCTKNRPISLCYGWIDVNGYNNGPNKEVKCSDGTRKLVTANDYNDCIVDESHITDVYPVWYHDDTVEPLTNAARYLLNR